MELIHSDAALRGSNLAGAHAQTRLLSELPAPVLEHPTVVVAVLNNQPQGGFVTRRPTADVDVANDDSPDDGFGSLFQPNRNSQPGNMRPRGGQFFYPMQRGLW